MRSIRDGLQLATMHSRVFRLTWLYSRAQCVLMQRLRAAQLKWQKSL